MPQDGCAVTTFPIAVGIKVSGVPSGPATACGDFSTVALDSQDKEAAVWAEAEKMGPSNERLLELATKFRAPQEWYDESIDPR